MSTVIQFRNATLGYGRKAVLRDVSFSIEAGEYFGMVGPNGAGKTTIIRTILGTLRPIGGEVIVSGAGGGPPRFGYVPQRDKIDSILPYTVEEVVMMGRYRELGAMRLPKPEDRSAVSESLRHVDIESLRRRAFNNLSGGQKQRVLIARALVARPEILILDEPTNGMDLSSRISILELISRLHDEERLTVMMVSHLLDDVANYVKRIAIVEQNFFQVGTVAEVLTGENLSALYRMDVRVNMVNGSTVILAWGYMGIPEIIKTIVQEFPYALFGSVLVGVICAFLGVYVVARRVVFLGAVLTQVSVFGIALTFLPFIPVNHTIGSLALALLAVIGLSRLLSGSRVPRDAVLGIVFVGAIAVRILIMQKTPKVEVAEIENLLRGDILFVTPELFFLMLGVFVVAMAIHLLFFKEFTYVSFDAETARTQGFRADFWEMLFYVIAAVVISVATHMVGDVLVFGFLVIPPVAAMLVTRDVRGIFLISALIGVFAPAVGLVLAFVFDFPASPAIVGVALLILGLAWVVSRIRGH